MAREYQPYSFTMLPADYADLRAFADAKDYTVSQLIRAALREYMKDSRGESK